MVYGKKNKNETLGSEMKIRTSPRQTMQVLVKTASLRCEEPADYWNAIKEKEIPEK